MATLARSALRQRVAAAVGALSGYDESRTPLSLFFRDPNTRRHGAFAVGVAESVPLTRQNPSRAFLDTVIDVAIGWKLKPKDQLASLDAALDGQEAVSVAVLGMSLANVQIILQRVGAPVLNESGEWARVDLSFRAVHLCAVV